MAEIQSAKEMAAVIISVCFLGLNSIMDIRKKRISLLLVGIYVLIWILFFMMGLFREGQLFERLVSGWLPGVLLCVIGIISRGALGLGDGILVMPVGLYLGIKTTGEMVLWAFLLAFAWGVLLLCFGKKKKEYAFPFAPFFLLGLLPALWF